MIPPFSNPHFLPQSFKTVTRAELYLEDPADAGSLYKEDLLSIQQLNKTIERYVLYDHALDTSSGNARKRRRLEVEDQASDNHEKELRLVFRLISSTPQPISLLPAPSPPSLTREPDAEDDEDQAATRRQRAEAVSIEGATIIEESDALQSVRSSSRKCLELRAFNQDFNKPHVMLLQTSQSPRKTRPPVPAFSLTQCPYVSDATTLSSSISAPNKANCLVLDAERVESQNPVPHRRRRKASALPAKARPPPQFWRPSWEMTGKCRGYAYGYPGSLITAESGYSSSPTSQKYRRDKMRKGIYVQNSSGW